MSQELNVDELEALLGDLDGGSTPSTTIDADVSDAVILDEAPAEAVAAKPRASRTPKRNLKAIPQEKIDEQRGPSDDELADLEGLDGEMAVTTAADALTSATEAVTTAEDLGDLEGLEDLDATPAATTPVAAGAVAEDDLPFDTDEATGLDADLAATAVARVNDGKANISLEDLEALAGGGDLDEAEKPTQVLTDLMAGKAEPELAKMLDEGAGLAHPGAIVVGAEKLAAIMNPEETLAKAGLTAAITSETTARVEANVELEIDVDALLKESGGEAVTISVAGGAVSSTPVAGSGSKGATGSGKATPTPSLLSYVPSAPLKTFIDEQRLQEDLSFTTNNLSLAMTRQAALFAHYGRLAAEATYQADRAKQQVELAEAELDQTFRDGLTAAGTKFTEAMIKSMIIKDSGYQAAQSRAYEAKAIAKMIGTAADSFDHRKDMLIQCGADAREEKKGNLRMKEHPGEAAVAAMEKQ